MKRDLLEEEAFWYGDAPEEGCTLCPRECHAKRTEDDMGYCSSPWYLTAARASLHMWEEPVISGILGSGTVFFSGCGLGCVFCQNRSIALGEVSRRISLAHLSEIFLQLQERGAHNINLVTGSHYVPQIAKALELAKNQGLNIPIVYNTGSYEKPETLRLLEGLVDIYLPDLKFFDPAIAARYANAPDYFEKATAAIAEMYRQVGDPKFHPLHVEEILKKAEKTGQEITGYAEDMKEYPEDALLMVRGVIVRHLMLPGRLSDSKYILEYLYKTYGDHIYISLMNQYTPCNELPQYPELAAVIPESAYEELVDHAISFGLENGFIQEGGTASESFIPDFDYRGL